MAWTTPSTVVAGQTLSAAFWNEQVRDNLTELAPFFGAWTSYTPTFTAVTTNPNVGTTGAVQGMYKKIGSIVFFAARVQTGGTGVSGGTGEYRISLPFVRIGYGTQAFQALGSGWVYTGSVWRTVSVDPSPASDAVRMISDNGPISSTVGAITALNEFIVISGTYQAAV